MRKILQLEEELKEAHNSAAESGEALSVRQQERSFLEEQIQTLQKKLSDLVMQSTQMQARQAEKEIHIDRLKASLVETDREVIASQDELTSAQKSLKYGQVSKEEKTKNTQSIQQELVIRQDKLHSLAEERKEQTEKISAQKAFAAQIQAEINVLQDAEINLTGYEEGARILLQAVKEKRLDGAIGSLGSNLIVPEAYESAVAAILGEYIDALIVRSISQTDNALDLIESETIRGSILPLDAISTVRPLVLDLEKAPVEAENILGIAANLVRADERIKPIVDLLLGQVIIVKDRKTARTIISSGDWQKMPNMRVVTLRGEMYLSSGPIIRGASRKGLLVRPRQQRESKAILEKTASLVNELEEENTAIGKKIDALQLEEKDCIERYKKAQEEESDLNKQVNQLELQVEKIQRGLQWHRDQRVRHQADIDKELLEQVNLKADIEKLQAESREIRAELERKRGEADALPLDELQAQSAYWNTNAAVIEQALEGARNRQQDKLNQLGQLEINLDELNRRSAQLELDIKTLNETMTVFAQEENETAVKIEQLSNTVNPVEAELGVLEKEHNGLLSTDTEARQTLRNAEQQYTQAKIALAHHQELFETLRGHIEDDFGLVSFDYTESVTGPKPLPLDGMVEELPKVEVLSAEIEDTIRQQKGQIRRMGAINPEAQNEYQEVKERFEFLTSQVEDLLKAEGDIREVIAELDLLMEREFQRTFDAVAQEFKQIFTRLFGGGSARLALTDPENISETGIDIEARLPGRREQGLSLLSGGERSLTAAALIFALLRVSPTPFCILDEVDAMLDEANVGRFRDLLTELSEKTQFIVITHNRNTVQAASIIYGITMGRDSASQVISLRMDELGEEFGV